MPVVDIAHMALVAHEVGDSCMLANSNIGVHREKHLSHAGNYEEYINAMVARAMKLKEWMNNPKAYA